MNLSGHVKITSALTYASGTASRNGDTLDMSGWDGVLGIVTMGTIAASAVGDVHWEQGATTTPATDLEGTAIVSAADDDDQVWVLDLYRPTKRYVRLVVTKDASNAMAESAVYIQYSGHKLPVEDMGADEYELHCSPDEGTK